MPIEPGMIVEVVRPQYSIRKGEELKVIAVSHAMDGSSCINALRLSTKRYIVIRTQNVVFKRFAPVPRPRTRPAPKNTSATQKPLEASNAGGAAARQSMQAEVLQPMQSEERV